MNDLIARMEAGKSEFYTLARVLELERKAGKTAAAFTD